MPKPYHTYYMYHIKAQNMALSDKLDVPLVAP